MRNIFYERDGDGEDVERSWLARWKVDDANACSVQFEADFGRVDPLQVKKFVYPIVNCRLGIFGLPCVRHTSRYFVWEASMLKLNLDCLPLPPPAGKLNSTQTLTERDVDVIFAKSVELHDRGYASMLYLFRTCSNHPLQHYARDKFRHYVNATASKLNLHIPRARDAHGTDSGRREDEFDRDEYWSRTQVMDSVIAKTVKWNY